MKKCFLSFVFIVISMLMTQLIFAGDNGKALYSSVLFNGKPLVYEQFSLSSRGIITMVLNDPKTKETKLMPFKVYLKRQDKVVPFGSSEYGNGVSEIEVSEVLKFANLGDQLVIEPVEKNSQMFTRVIFLRYSYFLEFLYRGNNKDNKDGC